MFFKDDSFYGSVECDEEGWKVESYDPYKDTERKVSDELDVMAFGIYRNEYDLNLDEKIVPEVYNFQEKSPEQVHSEFLADQIRLQAQIDAGVAVSHPEFPDNWELDMEGLAKMWDDVARAMPEYAAIADEWVQEIPVWHRRLRDSSGYLSPSAERLEVLKLAGVVPEESEDGEGCRPDYRHALMKAIHNHEFSEDMVLDIIDEKLCVNGVPTKISGEGIEYLFLGLLELEGEKRALDFTAKVVRKKLKKLF